MGRRAGEVHPPFLTRAAAEKDLEAAEAAVADIWRAAWRGRAGSISVSAVFEKAKENVPRDRISISAFRELLEEALGLLRDSHLYVMAAGDELGRISEPSSPVHWRRLSPEIGLLRIDRFPEPGQPFGEVFPQLIDRAFSDLKETAGLILDLRNNAGGDPNQADRLFDYLASTTVFLYYEVVRRSDAMIHYLGRERLARWRWEPGALYSQPLAVTYQPKDRGFKYRGNVLAIADSRTVSAAEYVLGALIDNGLAKVAGEKTPGSSGSVVPAELPNSRLIVAIPIQHALRKDMTTLQGSGIVPDFPLEPRSKTLIPRAMAILRQLMKESKTH